MQNTEISSTNVTPSHSSPAAADVMPTLSLFPPLSSRFTPSTSPWMRVAEYATQAWPESEEDMDEDERKVLPEKRVRFYKPSMEVLDHLARKFDECQTLLEDLYELQAKE